MAADASVTWVTLNQAGRCVHAVAAAKTAMPGQAGQHGPTVMARVMVRIAQKDASQDGKGGREVHRENAKRTARAVRFLRGPWPGVNLAQAACP